MVASGERWPLTEVLRPCPSPKAVPPFPPLVMHPNDFHAPFEVGLQEILLLSYACSWTKDTLGLSQSSPPGHTCQHAPASWLSQHRKKGRGDLSPIFLPLWWPPLLLQPPRGRAELGFIRDPTRVFSFPSDFTFSKPAWGLTSCQGKVCHIFCLHSGLSTPKHMGVRCPISTGTTFL